MVKVFTTQTCGQCRMVKKLLDYKQIDYEAIDITHDFERQIELSKVAGELRVPITQIGEQFIVGYNPTRILKEAATLVTAS